MTPQNNILVDSDGVACISEYGLEGVLRDEPFSKSIPTNVRWMAPEVLPRENKDKRVTSVGDGKCADVYSLAMVMFEVGQARFSALDIEAVSHLHARSSPVPQHSPKKVTRRSWKPSI